MPLTEAAQRLGRQISADKRRKTERNAKMVEMADSGMTFEEIGRTFGVTKPRAWQIVTRERKKMGQAA